MARLQLHGKMGREAYSPFIRTEQPSATDLELASAARGWLMKQQPINLQNRTGDLRRQPRPITQAFLSQNAQQISEFEVPVDFLFHDQVHSHANKPCTRIMYIVSHGAHERQRREGASPGRKGCTFRGQCNVRRLLVRWKQVVVSLLAKESSTVCRCNTSTRRKV